MNEQSRHIQQQYRDMQNRCCKFQSVAVPNMEHMAESADIGWSPEQVPSHGKDPDPLSSLCCYGKQQHKAKAVGSWC